MDGKQKSVAAITQELQNCSEEALIALCSNLRTDPRKSVQLLAEKAMKRLEKEKKELVNRSGRKRAAPRIQRGGRGNPGEI